MADSAGLPGQWGDGGGAIPPNMSLLCAARFYGELLVSINPIFHRSASVCSCSKQALE